MTAVYIETVQYACPRCKGLILAVAERPYQAGASERTITAGRCCNACGWCADQAQLDRLDWRPVDVKENEE